MERRMAALYGHDPRELETGAQILVLRGVHPTIQAARAALVKVPHTELPEKPTKAPSTARLGPQRLVPADLRRLRHGQLR